MPSRRNHLFYCVGNGADAFLQRSCNIRGQRSDTASLRVVDLEKWNKKAVAAVAPPREREKEKRNESLQRWITPLNCQISQIPSRHLLTRAGKLAQCSECERLRNPERRMLAFCQNHNEEDSNSPQIDSKQTFWMRSPWNTGKKKMRTLVHSR